MTLYNKNILCGTPRQSLLLCAVACLAFGASIAEANAQPSWLDTDAHDSATADIHPRKLSLDDLQSLEGFTSAASLAPSTGQETATKIEALYTDRSGKTLSQFGYDLFAASTALDNIRPSGMVGDGYILGTGDKIDVILRGGNSERQQYEIDSSGLLVIDRLPPIKAAGKTLGAIRRSAENEAARLHNLQIHLALAAPRMIDVLVIGDVGAPGRKTLSSFHTVLDALHKAEGIRKTGSLRQIKLVRSGKSHLIDLYMVMMQGGDGGDMRLQDGDRLIVPPIGATVAVAGAVKRPAIYEIKRGQNLSAMELLGLAGGVLSPGNNRFIRLALTGDGQETVEDVTDPARRIFQDGSILDVAQAQEMRRHHVTLSGEARHAGAHDIKRTGNLSDLLGHENAFGDSVYPLIGVIERRDPRALTRHLIEFSPRMVLQGEQDDELHEGDTVHLFTLAQVKDLSAPLSSDTLLHPASHSTAANSIEDADIRSFLRERITFIRGAVRSPGAYPLARGSALETLLAAAGGATVEADRDNIELTSLRDDQGTRQPRRRTLKIDSATLSATRLAPGDTVRLNRAFNKIEDQSVILSGEVRNPGKYDLLPGDTMRSLLARAGGLSDIAYPPGVLFSRASERRSEENRYRAQARDLEMKLAAALQAQDKDRKPDMAQISATQSLIAQLKDARAAGRITVEADPGILMREPELDILLEAGDRVHIPRRPLSVRVEGEVLSPAALQFRSGKDARTYIAEAGGTTYFADMGRAFILYPNGSAQPLSGRGAFRHSAMMIPPGSTIIVPRDPKPYDFLDSAEKISGILANIALTGFYVHYLNDDD